MSSWVQYQNSFNDAILKALLVFLKKKRLKEGTNIINIKKALIDYGTLQDKNNDFSKKYPGIANVFRDMNTRRHKLPGSHPYDKRTGDKAIYLKTKERNKFADQLTVAYNQIIIIVETSS